MNVHPSFLLETDNLGFSLFVIKDNSAMLCRKIIDKTTSSIKFRVDSNRFDRLIDRINSVRFLKKNFCSIPCIMYFKPKLSVSVVYYKSTHRKIFHLDRV